MSNNENNFRICGKVEAISEVININEKFKKRVVILEVFDDKKKTSVPFELHNQYVSQTKSITVGEYVGIDFMVWGWTAKDGKNCYPVLKATLITNLD